MPELLPILPPELEISVAIADLIQRYCPLSTIEIVDEGNTEHKIYKYVGICDQQAVARCIPSENYIVKYFRRHVVSLYEGCRDHVCVFWHDNVLVVLISNTEDQHEGVMPHYEDAAALLSQIGCDLVCQIRMNTKEVR